MSSLQFHTIQGLVAGAELYPVIGDHAVPFSLGTVLIDLDHVIEYIRDMKCCDVRGLFTYAKLTELNLKKNFVVLSAFHTIECFALTALLASAYPPLWYVLAGMLFHVAADIVNLRRLGRPRGRAYSLIEYVVRSRDPRTITRMAALLRRDDVETRGVQRFEYWKQRWESCRARLEPGSGAP